MPLDRAKDIIKKYMNSTNVPECETILSIVLSEVEDLKEATYTLLIWEEIPENTSLYLIPNNILSEEQAALLKDANGKVINCNDQCDSLDFLNVALVEEKYKDDEKYWANFSCGGGWSTNMLQENKCIFAKYKVGDRESNSLCPRGFAILRPKITDIVMSGFAL